MWLRRKSILLRLYMDMNVSVESILVRCTVITYAYNFALRILGCLGRQAMILTCNGPLTTLALAILHFPSPSGGVNEPFV